jgi:hypothetical protein
MGWGKTNTQRVLMNNSEFSSPGWMACRSSKECHPLYFQPGKSGKSRSQILCNNMHSKLHAINVIPEEKTNGADDLRIDRGWIGKKSQPPRSIPIGREEILVITRRANAGYNDEWGNMGKQKTKKISEVRRSEP